MSTVVDLPKIDESLYFDPHTYYNFRKVTLYCMALFNLDSGNARVFTFLNTDKCLETACVFRGVKANIFVDVFSRQLIVSKEHPLYPFGEPVPKHIYSHLGEYKYKKPIKQ